MKIHNRTVTMEAGPENGQAKKASGKLLFVVNVDWFFLSHRSVIAKAAKEQGYDVYVAAADTGSGEKIRELGFKFIPIPFSRKGTHPIHEWRTFRTLQSLYKKIEPDLVHHVTIKPVLFGSLAALFIKRLRVVNAITGLGFMFSHKNRGSLLGMLVRGAYWIVLRNPRQHTIFQNPDDRDHFVELGLVQSSQTVVIRGSGVDCTVFKPLESPEPEKRVLLASRMIRDKGILEFYEAAQTIRQSGKEYRFVLAGMADDGNPNAIPEHELASWNREGVVEWWGHCTNMVELLQNSFLVVLPSFYPEGTPKILIEAAACGRPIVTTDKPGCREIVQDGINGILVPPNNSEALSEAIIRLIDNPELADRFGKAGRKLAVREFSDVVVIEKTLDLYGQLVDSQS